MDQTPAHDGHNPELLAILALRAQRIVEVGCSTGALAREFRRRGGTAHYTGIELDAHYAELARRHCDAVLAVDIETMNREFLRDSLPADCWVFGDTLEHLRDPWSLLARIRAVIPSSGCIAACIPNAQHWTVQALLNAGVFRYQASGLLDRTHLRWFTRTTIGELFEGAGFRVVEWVPRIFREPGRDRVLPGIRALAAATGADPDQAVNDAIPLQYVVRAVPR